jgi:hypothetical protein
MRLLRCRILIRMARAHRHPAEFQPGHDLADCSLMDLAAEFAGDLIAQINQPPAHNLVAFKLGAAPNPLCQLGFLLLRQLARRRSRIASVPQPFQTQFVLAMHPVTQGLSVHPGAARRLQPGLAFQNQGHSQSATRHCRIVTSCRRLPKLSRVQFLAGNLYRHVQVLRLDGS